nr:GNAT family N-acetyltransferase [uncultured Allomuricauda sp.]
MGVDNPFTSETFAHHWAKHFNKGIKPIPFRFLNQVCCYQSKIPGLYINVGKNLTKGISYNINDTDKREIRGKTFLFYDVFSTSSPVERFAERTFNDFGHFSIRQYPGYLIELKSFSSLEDYISHTFKKSSRYKLRKYKNRLESCFDISFKSIGPDVSKGEYDFVFERFRTLLEKRFNEKKIRNNNLDKREWDFYKDVALPLIKEEKATLFVLYNGYEPISITLGYLSDKRIFDAITVFDIDYAKFHLGSIKIMYLINWAITNNWDILDFSKGHFEYKKRWSNKKYYFHYNVIYDSKSLTSKLLATVLRNFFRLKQYLRDKKINEKLHRFTFRIKNFFPKKQSHLKYEFHELKEEFPSKNYHKMNHNASENLFLKKVIFDFLYLNNESYNEFELYGIGESDRSNFVLSGKKKKVQVKIL